MRLKNSKSNNKWDRIRARGRMKYIIFNGIISWGIPTAMLYTLIITLWETKTIELNKEFFNQLISSLIIFPFVGIGVGMWTWRLMESNYQKNKK